MLVSTFNCGLYLMDGLTSDTPSARLVASFPRKDGTRCAIPVIAGHYYLVTVPAWSAVVSMDISNPAAPKEVSRITLGANDVPHWISLAPDGRRVVVTGYQGMQHRVVIARFDSTTGQLGNLDERFREEGATEAGFPHGQQDVAARRQRQGYPARCRIQPPLIFQVFNFENAAASEV